VPVEVDLAVAARVGRAHVVPRGSGAGLGHRVVEDLLAGAHVGEDGLLLLFGALAEHGVEARQLVEDVGRASHAAEHFVGGGERRPVQSEPVVLFGQEDPVESDLADGLDPFDGVLRLLVAFVEVLLPRTRAHDLGEPLDHEGLVFVE
jgi:hypothetical protein